MIISISGMPGAGKSTVAKMLSRNLSMKRYYMGGMRRELARKKGMTIDRLNKIGEKEAWTDSEVDDYQKSLAKTEDNFIIEGRTSFFLIPHSFKIFLDVNLHTGAKRIFEDVKKNPERNELVYKSVSDAESAVRKRMKSDRRRYIKYYGVDIYDKSHYDFVIDTTNMSPEEVTGRILSALKKHGK